MKRFTAFVAGMLLAAWPAFAGPADPGPAQSQSALVGCKYNSSGVTLSDQDQAALQCTSDGKLSVSASVSASVSGFTPNGSVASLSVTSSTGNVALPTGTVVSVTNTGSNTAYYNLSVGAGTAATTDAALVAGATVGLTVGSNTYINAITASSTTTLRLAGGAGLVSGYGGGSSGGGAGGAVTASGTTAHDAAGTSTDPVLMGCYASAAAPTSVSADGDATRNWCLRNGAQATVITAAGALVGGDATNGLDVDITRNAALVAGSAIIGKVGIDQTTPGTTNAVAPVGSVAHDAAGTSVNPVLEGCYASAAAPTDVSADGDAVRAWCTRDGARAVYVKNNGTAQGAAISGQTPSTIACQALTSGPSVYTTATTNPVNCNEYGAIVTAPYALQDRLVKGTTSAMTGTTSTSLLAAPGSGLKNYITTLSCVNSHATVGTFVTIQDGSGGTAIWTVAAAALFGGTAITFPAPLQQPTANTALYVANVTTGANVICSASGYKAP